MELPLAQIPAQGSCEAPAATFSTFQPVGLPRRSCQGLSLPQGPRLQLQAPKAVEAQASPRVPAVPAAACAQAPGPASSPEDAEKAEAASEEGGQSLRAETRAWFQRTQAHWLLQQGAAPAWFHGFITRREAERLLEPKPEGCYLVRFSESAVTFVLTYRSRARCRHFLLTQLGDGRHVVLGEDSAHARLQDLLQHYTACPLSPYGETLSEPLARQTPEPTGLSLSREMSDSGDKSLEISDSEKKTHPQYSPILKKLPNADATQREGAAEPPEPKEPTPPRPGLLSQSPQPPRSKPPVPAKPQLPPVVYTNPASRPRPAPPPKPSNPIYHEPDEPIAFYAMGRGSPGEPPSNVYAEVEMQLPPAAGGPPCALGHPALRKCLSRPGPQSQNPAGQQLHSDNSVTGQGPSVPHQPLPCWGHTLPHKLSRQRTEDRGQAWLSLGPPR
ncbi:SH2 domain-containing protein 2A isoform X2 [Suricata suricatta]|uniref:SH2 domain-containing protein 2A isoform X2 n=1 Tax=Suricata suricatta TaxID=37032 RepID=UPI00115533B4|nr:SH2 domain-containing protein 2A isoform X2 [Suricata suricatta]